MKKTHIVLDKHYTPDEGQEVFVGTQEECQKFVSQQGGSCSFMYDIKPMTKKEFEFYNNQILN